MERWGKQYFIGQYQDSNGNGLYSFSDIGEISGVWQDPLASRSSAAPEPGDLALLAAGIGFMYRLETISDRV